MKLLAILFMLLPIIAWYLYFTNIDKITSADYGVAWAVVTFVGIGILTLLSWTAAAAIGDTFKKE